MKQLKSTSCAKFLIHSNFKHRGSLAHLPDSLSGGAGFEVRPRYRPSKLKVIVIFFTFDRQVLGKKKPLTFLSQFFFPIYRNKSFCNSILCILQNNI